MKLVILDWVLDQKKGKTLFPCKESVQWAAWISVLWKFGHSASLEKRGESLHTCCLQCWMIFQVFINHSYFLCCELSAMSCIHLYLHCSHFSVLFVYWFSSPCFNFFLTIKVKRLPCLKNKYKPYKRAQRKKWEPLSSPHPTLQMFALILVFKVCLPHFFLPLTL